MADKYCTCNICNKEFVTSRKRKYCSAQCSERARTLKRNPLAKKRTQSTYRTEGCKCNGCGITYIPKAANRTSYCSRDCAYKHRDQWAAVGKINPYKPGPYSKVYFKDCGHCRNTFVTRWRLAPTCSSNCMKGLTSTKALIRNIANTKRDLSRRSCKCCSKAFKPEYGDQRSVYCSKDCLRKHSRRMEKAKRRAIEKGVGAESVDPFKVFDRDRWRCQLCGTKTPRRQRGKNASNSPELDHIIPISKGGVHSYLNTQCLCRVCNSTKSSEIIGQLLLVG
jgi:hypothetical protein